jgi:hypothetical protein
MKSLSILCLASFLGSIIFYGIHNEYLIFNLHRNNMLSNTQLTHHEKKIVTLLLMHPDKLYKEETEILWSKAPEIAATYLIQSWLNFR